MAAKKNVLICRAECRLVGVTRDGALLKINNADSARGLRLQMLIVPARHLDWYKKNERVLKECLWHNGQTGTAMFIDSVLCEKTRAEIEDDLDKVIEHFKKEEQPS